MSDLEERLGRVLPIAEKVGHWVVTTAPLEGRPYLAIGIAGPRCSWSVCMPEDELPDGATIVQFARGLWRVAHEQAYRGFDA